MSFKSELPNFVNEILNFVHNLNRADNAAFDLWTWLPSYKEAQRHHGHHAGEFMPSHADIMIEAAIYIDKFKNDGNMVDEYFECPCGEGH